MEKYEMRILPAEDDNGNVFWTVSFPAIEGCIGGGYNIEDAIKEAKENLHEYLGYLKSQKKNVPREYTENKYNGKIALRVSKTTHTRIWQCAETEGVSINSLINNAIEYYLGQKSYETIINQKINELQDKTNLKYEVRYVGVPFNYSSTFKQPFINQVEGF